LCKVIKETLLQKNAEEIYLLKNDAVVAQLREEMGNALSSFADVCIGFFIRFVLACIALTFCSDF